MSLQNVDLSQSELNQYKPVIIITDPGRDPDDEAAAIVTCFLVNRKFLDLRYVLANLSPSLERARLIKWVYDCLGVNVPVGVGSNCTKSFQGESYEFSDRCSVKESDVIQNGQGGLVKELENSSQPITLILLSGLTDAAWLLVNHPQLCKKKVEQFVLQSGVELSVEGLTELNAKGYLVPNNAANNAFDVNAAKVFYDLSQSLRIPLKIITREVAYACPVPKAFYDQLRDTTHPVGVRLHEIQKEAITSLYCSASLPADHPDRHGFPNDRDSKWFFERLCGLNYVPEIGDPSEVWDYIPSFKLYDLFAILAMVFPSYFEPYLITVEGVENQIIGLTQKNNGVVDPEKLAKLVQELMLEGLS